MGTKMGGEFTNPPTYTKIGSTKTVLTTATCCADLASGEFPTPPPRHQIAREQTQSSPAAGEASLRTTPQPEPTFRCTGLSTCSLYQALARLIFEKSPKIPLLLIVFQNIPILFQQTPSSKVFFFCRSNAQENWHQLTMRFLPGLQLSVSKRI